MIIIRTNYQYEIKIDNQGGIEIFAHWGDRNGQCKIGENFKNIDEAIEFINEYDKKCN